MFRSPLPPAPEPAAEAGTEAVGGAPGSLEVVLVPLSARAKAMGVSPGSLARQARRGQVQGATLIAKRWYVPDPDPVLTIGAGEVRTDPNLALGDVARHAQ